MAVDMEAIWDALATRLQANASGFVTITRRRKQFAIEELPALIVTDDSGDETVIDAGSPEPQWRITGNIVVVAKTQPADVDEKPAAALNDLVKSVRAALERQTSDAIGMGLSYYTDLDGAIDSLAIVKVEKGVLDNQSVADITVEMETNPA
jgi:hypothetical protein